MSNERKELMIMKVSTQVLLLFFWLLLAICSDSLRRRKPKDLLALREELFG